MKKTVLAIASLMMVSLANAQLVKFGIKGGVNVTNFKGSVEEIKTESIVGFHGGVFLNFGLGDVVALQPEALISTSGAKITTVSGSQAKDYKLTYMAVPVMLRIKPVGPLFIELGPQFGFKIGDNLTDETVKEEYNNLDLAAAAGIGLQIKGFTIGARYIAGLNKVGDFEFGSSKPDFKNGTIQAGIAIRF